MMKYSYRHSKGQMFIVTVIFLVGVVFVVQQILLQYSYLDPSSSYKENDYLLMKSTEEVATQAVVMASTCSEAEKNLEEALLFLSEQNVGGYSVKVEYNVNCTNWDNSYPDPGPVLVDITVTSENSETNNKLMIYSKGAVPCECSDWMIIGCGPAVGCGATEMRLIRTCSPSFCLFESECVENAPFCSAIHCRITASGGACTIGEVEILHLSSQLNAHAELPSQSMYPFKFCCMGPSLGNDCAGSSPTAMLALSSQTNAHVEFPQSIYPESVCFSGIPTACATTVNPGDTCDDVQPGSECLFSLSTPPPATNAHVSNCTGAGSYSTKMCCWLT